METIKTTIRNAIEAEYGACSLKLDNADLCITICIHAYRDYVLYVRPDDRQTHYLCHYAHREDLESCADNSAEMEAWKQQQVYQLIRRVPGGLQRFVAVACEYVRDAVRRIELMKGVLNGRGFYKRVRTFEEAKLEAEHFKKPRRPPPVLPPPVCRRHNPTHWEADKKKRKLEDPRQKISTKPPATSRP